MPTVSANTWSLPAVDLSLPGRNALYPQVAIAPDGATTVTWIRNDGSNWIIQAATRPAGSNTFGAPEDLSLPGEDAEEPQVAVAPDGATTVTWFRFDGSNYIIQAATRPAGSNTFGAPQDLSQAGQSAVRPQLAIDPDGATTVTWVRSDGSNNIIQARTRPAGSSTFGAVQDLSGAGRDATNPQVAIAPDGATTVTWERFNGNYWIIQTATRPAGSNTFGAPEGLSSPDRSSNRPQLAITSDGATTVVWQHDGGGSIVQTATRPAGSETFGDPENLSEAGQNAEFPRVAIAPDGATTVVWQRSNGSNSIIQARTRPAESNAFGAAQDLSEAGQNATDPQVAIAPDGATTVVWRRFNGSNLIIQVATRPAESNTFGAAQDLSGAGQNATQATVATDEATTVTWSRNNGSNWIIQAVSSDSTFYRLSVTRSGTGTGTVTSDPAGIDCGSTCEFDFSDGESVTLTAAAADSTFTGWSGAGCSGTGSCEVTMSEARSVTATFTADPPPPVTRQLSVTKSGDGTGTITSTPAGIDCGSTCESQFNLGTQVTLTAAATSGSTFTGWSGACTGAETCSVTMSEARSVTATFTADPSPPTPTSKVEVSSVRAKVTKKSVLITSKVKVSGKGKISQQATTGKGQNTKAWCKTSKTIGAAGTYTLECNLGNKGRKAIRKQALKLTLRTTFAPAKGSKVTANRKLTVKRKR